MIRHLLKLTWNRKRANALILVEIFFSFLVVFAVSLQAVYLWTNARRPLGFDVDGVWHVTMDVDQATNDVHTRRQVETFARVLEEAERLEGVERAAGALTVPYSDESRTEGLVGDPDRPRVSVEIDEVTDAFAEVVGVELVAGRWFEPADDAFDWMPVVLDLEAARALFGDANPVGRWLQQGPDRPRRRVVGVVSDFRQHGELSGPQPYMFERVEVAEPRHRPPRNLVLKMVPGSTADYEEAVLERLRAVAPEWTFAVKPLSVLRGTNLRLRLIPLGAVAMIAGFLMVMVALGLMGVLWQNVVQRTREIGLRRASGATRGDVHRQVLAELLLVTTMAVGLGTLLVVQLPILALFESLSTEVFVAGLLASLGLVYLLAAACALYPSWMAGRVHPAEALRWE
jgi:putative ABC transport system permease protein